MNKWQSNALRRLLLENNVVLPMISARAQELYLYAGERFRDEIRDWVSAEREIYRSLIKELIDEAGRNAAIERVERWRRLRELLLCDQRVREMIANEAYNQFQLRGGVPGQDLDNWLNAENIVLRSLLNELYEEEKRCIAAEEKVRFDLDVMSWGGS